MFDCLLPHLHTFQISIPFRYSHKSRLNFQMTDMKNSVQVFFRYVMSSVDVAVKAFCVASHFLITKPTNNLSHPKLACVAMAFIDLAFRKRLNCACCHDVGRYWIPIKGQMLLSSASNATRLVPAVVLEVAGVVVPRPALLVRMLRCC